MIVYGHTFVLLFSHFANITHGPPISVFSDYDCARMCLTRETCSSFFYNPDTNFCTPSTTRYFSTADLPSVHGYQYFIMRPDCDGNWTLIDGQCYLMIAELVTVNDAQSVCSQLGGFHAKTDSLADDLIIKSFSKSHQHFTLGGTDREEEGVWVWMDGSPITLNLWAPDQPSNTYAGENCLEQRRTGWNDVRCEKQLPCLCEK